ncbi:hypothetical protein B0J17DRAFT_631143 [Rhizoctonia solani]|nr:hypothetical protein B0J17DRAFT_631143 [Rhizoctonia solani]
MAETGSGKVPRGEIREQIQSMQEQLESAKNELENAHGDRANRLRIERRIQDLQGDLNKAEGKDKLLDARIEALKLLCYSAGAAIALTSASLAGGALATGAAAQILTATVTAKAAALGMATVATGGIFTAGMTAAGGLDYLWKQSRPRAYNWLCF